MSKQSEMIIYQTQDGLTQIDVTFDNDTVWLSLDEMASLFQRDRSVIGKHIKNIFTDGELQRDSVWAKFAHTANDGKEYLVDYYNLDVIISVGYRVKSQRGVQFRIWASGIIKEYMKKGFAMDDQRLKELGGGGYFRELLERIRDIRAWKTSKHQALRKQDQRICFRRAFSIPMKERIILCSQADPLSVLPDPQSPFAVNGGGVHFKVLVVAVAFRDVDDLDVIFVRFAFKGDQAFFIGFLRCASFIRAEIHRHFPDRVVKLVYHMQDISLRYIFLLFIRVQLTSLSSQLFR